MTAAVAATLTLAIVHVLAARLRIDAERPRGIWISLAGGVSVAEVFLQLLPELVEGQAVVARHFTAVVFLERHVFLLALAGLATFYGLESFVRYHRRPESASSDPDADFVFWIHVGSFSVYNALIGYLIVERLPHGGMALLWYTLAMSLHFVVSDFSLRNHHADVYDRYGRWILAGSVVVGFAVSLVTHVSEPLLAVITSFLAGGVILNVMKEELPEEKETRFGAFVVGVALSAVLSLVAG